MKDKPPGELLGQVAPHRGATVQQLSLPLSRRLGWLTQHLHRHRPGARSDF